MSKRSDERQRGILDILMRQDFLYVRDIIAQLPASPATIRRDLVAMEQAGLIRKARGKIFFQAPNKAPAFDLRGLLHDREKNAIGKAAAHLVGEGDSIVIDSGTTTLAFAGHLRHFKRLSVITNSIPVAYVFNGTSVTTFVCGGMVHDMALIDEDALAYFSARRVNKAFLGATGVRGEEGLTVSTSYQYAVKRKMLESAEERYALIDSSKFEFMGISLFVDFSELTGIITSKPIQNERLLERLAKLNLRIIYAGAGEGDGEDESEDEEDDADE